MIHLPSIILGLVYPRLSRVANELTAGANANTLAKRFKVSAKTIQRDVARLRKLGYAVNFDFSANAYRLKRKTS